jgi:acyl-CoA thioester hydrolase
MVFARWIRIFDEALVDREAAALLEGFPVVLTLPVLWGDQDAFGHVNNTIYFRWLESARIAYGERVGLDRLLKSSRIGPILASVTCDFRRQVTYPDSIVVGARVTRIGRSSMTMEHVLVSEGAKAIAAESSSVLVVFDYDANKSHPVPDEIRSAIEALEGKAFS